MSRCPVSNSKCMWYKCAFCMPMYTCYLTICAGCLGFHKKPQSLWKENRKDLRADFRGHLILGEEKVKKEVKFLNDFGKSQKK